MRELVFFFFDEQKRAPAHNQVSLGLGRACIKLGDLSSFLAPSWLFFESPVSNVASLSTYVVAVSGITNTVGVSAVLRVERPRNASRISTTGEVLRPVRIPVTASVSGAKEAV